MCLGHTAWDDAKGAPLLVLAKEHPVYHLVYGPVSSDAAPIGPRGERVSRSRRDLRREAGWEGGVLGAERG